MENGVHKPFEKLCVVKAPIFQANSVKCWSLAENISWVFPVKCGKPNDGASRVEQIVTNIEKTVIDQSGREQGPDSKQPDWHRFKYVLVKDVAYCIRISPVSLPAMHKHEIFQESELANSIISGTCCLLSFQT